MILRLVLKLAVATLCFTSAVLVARSSAGGQITPFSRILTGVLFLAAFAAFISAFGQHKKV